MVMTTSAGRLLQWGENVFEEAFLKIILGQSKNGWIKKRNSIVIEGRELETFFFQDNSFGFFCWYDIHCESTCI